MKKWLTGTGVLMFLIGCSMLDSNTDKGFYIAVVVAILGISIAFIGEKFFY